MKKLLLGLGTLAAVVAPVTAVVACDSGTAGTTTITLKDGMSADEVKAALVPWTRFETALDKYDVEEPINPVYKDFGTFIFKLNGETETINAVAKVKELQSLGPSAKHEQRYTSFDDKVNVFVDGVGLESDKIAFNF